MTQDQLLVLFWKITDLPCHRQLGDERLARLDDLVSCHLDK